MSSATGPAAVAHEDVPSPSADLGGLSLPELRRYRRVLLSESERTRRWRRLVQARLELTVAVAAPEDDLEQPAPGLPEPPEPAALRALVTGPRDDTVGLLQRLQAAQRALTSYGDSVQEAASAATLELVERYAADPRDCLSAVPEPQDRVVPLP
jgi:hypothetical protein